MTVTSETVRVAYAGNGSTTVFSTSFIFEDNDHVVVTLIVDATGVETAWVEGTQYTLTGAGTGAAGSLTVDTSPTDYTPASGETLVIVRDVPHTQETDFPTGGSFPSSSVETALDLAAMRSAKNAFDIGRTLHAPDTDDSAIDMQLPNETDRASKFLQFNADGEPIAVTAVGAGLVTFTAAGEAMAEAADAAAQRTLLGLGTAALETIGTSGATVAKNDANIARSGTLTQTGATTITATLTAGQQVVASGDISPAQITANQNDYNPTGLSTALVLRLTSDALREITGLAGGADGRLMIVANRGSNSIDLNAEDALSSAENRFDSGDNIGLQADQGAILWYDSTDSRWVCVGHYLQSASQTSMEAAGTRRSYVSPARQQFNPGHPKVRAATSVAAGVPTLQESYNMTSITDTAAGQLTHTIATDFSTANWTPTLTVERAATALTVADIANVEVLFGGKAAGTLLAECWDDTATTHVAEDPASWGLVGLGDQ